MDFNLAHEAEQLSYSAEWRRGNAEEYPDDLRNLEAAEILEKLSSEVARFEGSDVHRKIEALEDDNDGFYFAERRSEYVKQIGFQHFPRDGAEYLADLAEFAESILFDATT